MNKDRKALAAAIKPIYTTPPSTVAQHQLDQCACHRSGPTTKFSWKSIPPAP